MTYREAARWLNQPHVQAVIVKWADGLMGKPIYNPAAPYHARWEVAPDRWAKQMRFLRRQHRRKPKSVYAKESNQRGIMMEIEISRRIALEV